MTGPEFRAARERLGLSAADLGRLWDMGRHFGRTVRRWESGEVRVNGIAAYCITLMIEKHEGGA